VLAFLASTIRSASQVASTLLQIGCAMPLARLVPIVAEKFMVEKTPAGGDSVHARAPMLPWPEGLTTTKFISAAAAPGGMPHPPSRPPWAGNPSVPATSKLRGEPGTTGPPASRVSRMRQGVTGV
jgi:hypothetical protein